MSHQPPVALLSELLSYEPQTGEFRWLPRARHHFKSNNSHSTWNARFAGRPAFTAVDGRGYLTSSLLGKTVKAHRVAVAIASGEWPTEDVDHLDGDIRNNRAANLRSVSKSVNAKNRRVSRKNRSGVNGVNWHKHSQRWVVRVTVNGRREYVGKFENLDDAVAARIAAASLHQYTVRGAFGG